MASSEERYVVMEFHLTKENAKILNQIDTIMVSPHYYINCVIEATASMKKFKDMRYEDTKTKRAKSNEAKEEPKEEIE